jgi:hypothetical protein
LWLEDDWKLNKDRIISFEKLFEILNNYSYVNLSLLEKNYIWALAPSIISFKLFEILHCKCWEINFTKKKLVILNTCWDFIF